MTKNQKTITTTKRRVLITGGTSGFGYEFAKIYAKEGYDLALVARDVQKLTQVARDLESVYRCHVATLSQDLASLHSARAVLDWTKRENLTIDTLINNAGIGNYGKFADIPFDKEHELLMLNIVTLAELCHLFINEMLKDKRGGSILNIASLAAFQPGPYYATYFASKSFVLHFTEALIEEYADEKNLKISALCPCPSPTDFFKKAGMRQDSFLLKTSFISPAEIAQLGYRGLVSGQSVVIPGFGYKVVATGYRLFPRKIINKITKMIVETAAMNSRQ